jgi:hypothetical protein
MTPYDTLAAHTEAFAIPLVQAFAIVQEERALAGVAPRAVVTPDILRLAFGPSLAVQLAAQMCTGLGTETLPALTPLEWKYMTLGAVSALRREGIAITSERAPFDSASVRSQCLAIFRATTTTEVR